MTLSRNNRNVDLSGSLCSGRAVSSPHQVPGLVTTQLVCRLTASFDCPGLTRTNLLVDVSSTENSIFLDLAAHIEMHQGNFVWRFPYWRHEAGSSIIAPICAFGSKPCVRTMGRR